MLSSSTSRTALYSRYCSNHSSYNNGVVRNILQRNFSVIPSNTPTPTPTPTLVSPKKQQQQYSTYSTTATRPSSVGTSPSPTLVFARHPAQLQSQQHRLRLQQPQKRNMTSFNFGSSEYATCFTKLPQPDPKQLRAATIEYLEQEFDPQSWYDDPIVSLLNGTKINSTGDHQASAATDNEGDTVVDTVNALGVVNGKQVLAGIRTVERLKEHITTYQSPYHGEEPYRVKIREIEFELLTKYAGMLIGNQCVDFQKQDGITEIEEAIMANTVERRLNDLLLRDEQNGFVTINRKPIYVSCVSNFTNFLDLFRKTIRSLEVGVPCIVLGRSNTSQHSYRWSKLLMDLLIQHEIDPGMLTFLSCTLDDIKHITSSCQEHTGNLYTTCSRELARDIKSGYPNTVASTGGPNTLVVTADREKATLTPEVAQAIRMSASIESSGQCTALRHCVLPAATDESEITKILDGIKGLAADDGTGAPSAMKQSMFDGVFIKHKGSPEPNAEGMQQHTSADAYYKINDNALPQPGINEFWRKVAVDFTKMDVSVDSDDSKQHLDQLAAWLNENQPISLAINGPRAKALKVGLTLFEKTGMVVNTIGSSDDPDTPPALTCQARPQEGEVFGEFPPRTTLNEYTRFPVVVPSSNPSYDATYTEEFLRSQQIPESYNASTRALLESIENELFRGYCIVLIRYLQDVTRMNPKVGFGKSRTAVWGIQRIPLGMKTYIRATSTAVFDDMSPIYTMFHMTNAKSQVDVSVEPSNVKMISICTELKIPHTKETEVEFHERCKANKGSVFNVVTVDGDTPSFATTGFPMVGNFVSLYFPLGHIKSTKPNDDEFQLLARLSDKWLNTLF